MKAIIIESPGIARFIETERPKVGPGDVLAKVVYTGICGTDLSILNGDMSLIREGLIKYPVRIGHEWSGIVEEVGAEVECFKPGDKVVSDTGVTCGICSRCLSGDINRCQNIRALGTINCWDGSFTEYMLMPQRHVYKLPDKIGLDEAALIEPATIALAALKHIGLNKDSSVLVIGTGAIGLAAVALAKYIGVSKILLSGRKHSKLEVGKELGADILINATKEDMKEAVMKYTGGEGVDAVIETSGNVDVVNRCIEVVRNGAKVQLIGFYEQMVKEFNIDKIVMNQVQINGILAEFGLVGEIIEIMASGKMNLKPLITHIYDFNEAIQVLKTANDKNDTKIKILIKISDNMI